MTVAKNQLTTGQFAAKHGVSRQRVLQWINAGRLPEARQIETYLGSIWQIPANAKPPEALRPGRKAQGKYQS